MHCQPTSVSCRALIMSVMFLLNTLAKISYSSHDSASRILQHTQAMPAAAAAIAAAVHGLLKLTPKPNETELLQTTMWRHQMGCNAIASIHNSSSTSITFLITP
jgi:hypothetical protein